MAPAWSFILNSDEETGSYHSFTALHTEAGAGYDAGLVFEPALPGGELVIARPGSGQFMLECRGRSAHVGREFAKGVSAVSALGECLVRIARLPDLARGKIVNVGPISGGSATNVVPELARAWGNVRFPSFAVGEELRRDLEALQTPGTALPSVTVSTSFNRPSKPTTPGVEALALAARSAAEDLGQRLPFGTTGGVCDGNILQDAGLAVIDTLGARGGGLHTREEWIEVASLVERAQLVALLLARMAERGAPSGT
jgi:glutamate carboxypeptidase